METLKQMREQTGRTQTDVAAQAGISREYLSSLETGRRPLSRNVAKRLAEIYGREVWEVLGIDASAETRALREEHKAVWGKLERLKEEHARELQAKQQEIDSLRAQLEEARHGRAFAESMCKMVLKQNNSGQDTGTDGENV